MASCANQYYSLPPLRPSCQAPGHITLPSIHELCPDYIHKTPYQTPHALPQQRHTHQTPSALPSPLLRSSVPNTPQSQTFPGSTVRIVLASSFDDASAALLFPAPGTPCATNTPAIISSASLLDNVPQGTPVLLVGAALARFNATGRRVPKGVRVHPYRLQCPPASSYRPSIVPQTAYA